MKNKKQFIPTIKALPRADGVDGSMFWCPWCKRWHYHGKTMGKSHRVAHCKPNSENPLIEKGYYIKMMTKRELQEIKSAIVAYLDK